MGAKDLLNKIPIFGSMFDDSDEQAQAEVAKNRALWDAVDLPNTTWETFNPDQYEYSGDFNPEAAQYEQIAEDPRTRSYQLSALQKMAGLADTGLSEVDQLGFARAQDEAGQFARQAREAALADARGRGVAGSGLEFALREMGSQGGANRQQQAAMETAAKAAEQRALYNQAYMSGLGNMRNQDFQANSANTGIINQFNMANTQNRNTAGLRNLDARQGIGNQNTALRNSSQQYNQMGRRDANQQGFQNQVTKVGGQTGANMGMAKAYAAENAANTAERNANADLLAKGAKAATSGGA